MAKAAKRTKRIEIPYTAHELSTVQDMIINKSDGKHRFLLRNADEFSEYDERQYRLSKRTCQKTNRVYWYAEERVKSTHRKKLSKQIQKKTIATIETSNALIVMYDRLNKQLARIDRDETLSDKERNNEERDVMSLFLKVISEIDDRKKDALNESASNHVVNNVKIVRVSRDSSDVNQTP
jgi:small-conductance mechanosensitive channel